MAGSLAELFWAADSGAEVWFEPFAGGAGAGLTALVDHDVPELWLADNSPALGAFWRTVLSDSERFAQWVETFEPTIETFYAARAAVRDACVDEFRLAQAAFLLNRCSRSGMIRSDVGPIGGRSQLGRWKLDCRWNAPALAERIRAVNQLSDRITFLDGDAETLLEDLPESGFSNEVFVFADPPYVEQGRRLYALGDLDHERLRDAVAALDGPWVMTYDDVPLVHSLYRSFDRFTFDMQHSAGMPKLGRETLVVSADMAAHIRVYERFRSQQASSG